MTLITRQNIMELPLMSKDAVARKIIDEILSQYSTFDTIATIKKTV